MDKNSEMEVGDILNDSEMAFICSDLRQAGVANSFLNELWRESE